VAHLWYPVHTALVTLLVSGGAGPSDVVGTESLAVGEAAVATLLPVATEPLTFTESATGLALVVRTESLVVSEDAQATQGANNLLSTDSAAVTDALTTLLALLTPVDAATVTDVSTTLDIIFSGVAEVFVVSETAVVLAIVARTDNATVSEIATPTLISSGNIADSEIVTLSEQRVASLAAVAVDTGTVTESVSPFASSSSAESYTVSEAALIVAPFVGVASISSVSLGPRVTLTVGAGAGAVTCDNTLITSDSTLTTCDGGYLAVVPREIGIKELLGASVEVE